ncbi:MAG: outer membrane protein transport protein [Helicobacteraceae bacterium]|jgi:long-chain fatty acid transport protein|nr:outer membrane protein transport protein [Helicobacteraceae bacterium]
MKKLLLVSAVAASTLMASGYKIPEQSLNSTALAGAYVSNTSAADAAYYNPANMAFMSSDKHLELNAMYIHLNPVDFSGSVGSYGDHTAQSASEDFIIPQIYLVAKPMGEDENVRIGLSINAPAGLSKRWPEGIEAAYAEEFTLKVIEVNPTVSYKIMDDLAIAVGARFVYSEGIVKTSGGLDLEGSSWDLGYNLALSYKPYEAWGMALTYRSNVDLTEEGGQATGYTAPYPTSTPASVTLPLPATLTLATDVDVTESTNIEFVYERAFWSAYDELNIEIPAMGPLPGQPAAKNWEDSNTVRLGLTQGIGESVKVMVGLAYDESPVPDETLGFELPDSDAFIGSVGVRWAMSEELDVGAALLYDKKKDRSVTNDTIDGKFSGSSATILSVGLGYKF